MLVFRFSSRTDAVTTCGNGTKQMSAKIAMALLMTDAVFFLKNRDNTGDINLTYMLWGTYKVTPVLQPKLQDLRRN